MAGEDGASFRIYVRCCDCLESGSVRLNVPAAEDAPTCVDELVESAALASLRFSCLKCEGVIGEIIGINQIEAAAA